MKKHFITFLFLAVAHLSTAGGYYLEFKISGNKEFSGTMKSWSDGSNSRSQMEMSLPGMPAGMGNMSYLFLASEPGKIFMLNDKDRTYFERERQKSDDFKDNNPKDYDIQVLGRETVNGYASTHVKIREKQAKGEIHMWVSKEVAHYAEMKKMKAKYISSEGMYAALLEKGVVGFPVRIKVEGSREMEIQMDLVKAMDMDVPASKFSLEGYSKNSLPANPMMDMDPEKLKNMTPEERQKMMEEIRKQYGK